MNTSLHAELKAGILAMIAGGGIIAALSKTENDFFQFCTTKAYGCPTPWKIDWCPCEKGMPTHPSKYIVVNLSVIAGSGIVGFALFSPRDKQQNKNMESK